MIRRNNNNLIVLDSGDHLNLEIGLILAELSQFSYFETNKNLLLNPPSLTTEVLTKEFDSLEKAQQFISQEKDIEFSHSISKLNTSTKFEYFILSISKGICLELKQLNQLITLLEISSDIDFSLSKNEHIHENLRQLKHPTILNLVKKFRHIVNEEGELDTKRHPILSELEIKIFELEDKIRKKINDFFHDKEIKESMQYEGHDLINDRYVIPIKTDSYQSSFGLIISRSESGNTLYIEPYELRELSQKRVELVSEFKKILFDIEKQFSEDLGKNSDLLKNILNAVFEIDLILAKAHFIDKKRLNRPKLMEYPGFKFESLFHPLIPNPIKNDISIDGTKNALVISGPNTGGKTAILKSIALSYHFLSMGLFVPALHAEMFPYSYIHFSSLDLQNISQGLSSFSGEVTHYVKLYERLDSENLIIVDEIFNSTSSDEASALAFSMMNYFSSSKQTQFLISTHHELLKRLTSSDEKYEVGSMGFDLIQLRPTFKFLKSTPGSSMALQIFSKLTHNFSLSSLITNEAKSYLDENHNRYEELLSELSQKMLIVDSRENDIKKRVEDLIKREKEHEGLLFLKKQDELAKLEEYIENIQKEGQTLLESVQSGEITKQKRLDDKLFDLKANLLNKVQTKSQPTKSGKKFPLLTPQSLKVGSRYYATTLSKDALLKSIDWRKKSALVSLGALQWNVPFDTLTKPHDNSVFERVEVSIQRSEEIPFQLDVRGMRLDEFEHLLEKSLSQILAGDINSLSIIHGHGDGVLKEWLRKTIGKSKDFSWTVPQTGNDGETEIKLRS